jgi:phosphoserine phosphatase RsbU/P
VIPSDVMMLEAAPEFAPTDKDPTRPSILVVDDQPDVREALRLLLKGAGFGIDTAASPEEALAATARGAYDLVVADMNYTWDTTSGQEGLRLVDSLRAQRRDLSIVAMTGWSSIELAVEAMQHGACDFIAKPWDNHRLVSVIEKHWAHRKDRDTAPAASELALARKIQSRLLPEPHFRSRGIECECASLPAREIGGDLYDFFELGSGTTAFLLGDVSGKGIGAALLMANLQATIRAQRGLGKFPARMMERVNGLFFESTRPEHFATLFYGIYEHATATIRYANCGHPAALLVREDGAFEPLRTTATVLGAFPNSRFEERSVAVRAGDRLVLFSDGFSESQIEALSEEQSDAWAEATILRHHRSSADGFAAALAALAVSDGEQADDITVMDVRLL